MECSSGPVTAHLRHHRVLIGGKTDDDMDRVEAASAADPRPECVPEDAHYVPVTHCNPLYIRIISLPPGGLEPPAYGLEVRRATTP